MTALSVKIYIFFAGFWIQSVYESISSYFSWKKKQNEIIRWGKLRIVFINTSQTIFSEQFYWVFVRFKNLHILFNYVNNTACMAFILKKTPILVISKVPMAIYSLLHRHRARKLLMQQQPSRESIRKTDLNLFFFLSFYFNRRLIGDRIETNEHDKIYA